MINYALIFLKIFEMLLHLNGFKLHGLLKIYCNVKWLVAIRWILASGGVSTGGSVTNVAILSSLIQTI